MARFLFDSTKIIELTSLIHENQSFFVRKPMDLVRMFIMKSFFLIKNKYLTEALLTSDSTFGLAQSTMSQLLISTVILIA